MAPTYTASLANVSAIFTSVVVFGAGIALTNAKNAHQALAVAIASVTFLLQRIMFMVLAESIPGLDCFLANDISYAALVTFRIAVLIGLYLRAAGSNRIYKSIILEICTYSGLLIGFVAVGSLIYIGVFSPYAGPDQCFQLINKTVTLISNACFFIALLLLTIVVSIPIFKALSRANSTGSGGMSRVHNQARVLSKFILLIPAILLVCMTSVFFISADNSNLFLFLTSLIFSDFCHFWLLLFPMIVMAGDNGEVVAGGSGSAHARSGRPPGVPHQRSTFQQEVHSHPDKYFTQSAYDHNEIPF
ncbi:hypothetical protein HK105_200032 [Polyrhizophydium stewartii]|uniref:Uncharacterized protein n=1 Tax=Polyrhizophydium stewartii TaxID=2732419 RepID=A0ABR4NKI7_9FUNG|nr:hypothetical protein HK105_003955 [Polyrhizophydium stewartii]